MGIDLIHNRMNRKLTPVNSLQSLIRPISSGILYHTGVGKFFEKEISSRLDWFIESRGIFHNSQAGLRRKRNTTDHIVQLEFDVKEGFAQKE